MKKFAAVVIILCLMAASMPPVSRAAVTPYFVAVNDALLPFVASNMPFVVGDEIFMPHEIFRQAGVFEIASADAERARLYRADIHVDFFTSSGVTEDQNGNALNWPSARKVGGTFYVPLRQVCNFFGLTVVILDVRRSIIHEEQMQLIRIMRPGMWAYNDATFLGIHSGAIRRSYDDYHAPPPQPSTPPPQTPQQTQPPQPNQPPDEIPPEEEPIPTFSDVTVYLSFYGIDAGGVDRILDVFERPASAGFRASFFVSTAEAAGNPELVRRISGSGHAVGIWLEEGTFEEYLDASALLFEAAKIRTALISADEAAESAMETAFSHSLIFWNTSSIFEVADDVADSRITDELPTDAGVYRMLFFACTDDLASELPGVLEYMQLHEYSSAMITETADPLMSGERIWN